LSLLGRGPRKTFSGPLVVELVADEDGCFEIADVTGGPAEPGALMDDADLLREEWSNVGLDLFFDATDLFYPHPRVVLWGRLWWERCETTDYGTEYDGGFEVEGVLEP